MAVLRTLIGEALRTTRLRQDRTLREVSGAARVSLGYLSEVERGQKEASSELLASICRALGVRLSDVLREVSESMSVLEAVPPVPEREPARPVAVPAQLPAPADLPAGVPAVPVPSAVLSGPVAVPDLVPDLVPDRVPDAVPDLVPCSGGPGAATGPRAAASATVVAAA